MTNKNRTNNYIPDPPLAGAASLPFQYGEFVNKANRKGWRSIGCTVAMVTTILLSLSLKKVGNW